MVLAMEVAREGLPAHCASMVRLTLHGSQVELFRLGHSISG